MPASIEAISNDIFRQTSASEYSENFPRLRQGLLSTSMGKNFATEANNQPANVVLPWEYNWVLFVVGQYTTASSSRPPTQRTTSTSTGFNFASLLEPFTSLLAFRSLSSSAKLGA